MQQADRVRLRHMLDAATEAMAAIRGKTSSDLKIDRVWAFGLVKCVEVVGEAAARVGEQTRDQHPQIPWAQIVAMRNRLVHAYFEVDHEQVWRTITADLPVPAAQLRQILDSEGNSITP